MHKYTIALIALTCLLFRIGAQVVDLDAIVDDTTLDSDDAFNIYLDAFGKAYDDPTEYSKHKAAFLESLQYIRDHNAAGSSSFQAGLTPMADEYALDTIEDDMDDDALIAQSTGNRKLLSSNLTGMIREKLTKQQLGYWSINNTVDWRPLAPPIMQQHANGSHCGACWAFAATGAVSIVNAQATGNILQLSQQQIVSCDTASRGCGGGGARRAMQYIYANGGVASAQTYPYKARTGKCNPQLAKQCVVRMYDGQRRQPQPQLRVAVDVKGYYKVPGDNETAMALALSQGPLTVSIFTGRPVYKAWTSYKGGVLDPTNFCNSTNDYCNTKSTHVVVVVGMTEVDGVPVWIIRNSWGEGWGDNGYGYIPRNKGTAGLFGLATAPSLPIV